MLFIPFIPSKHEASEVQTWKDVAPQQFVTAMESVGKCERGRDSSATSRKLCITMPLSIPLWRQDYQQEMK